MAEALETVIKARAAFYGFDACAITTPDAIAAEADHLQVFIDNGYHGDMDWLADTLERRGNPRTLWPECRSVIMLGMNYSGGPEKDPLQRLGETDRGVIARYARGRDYHDVIKGRLKQVAGALAAVPGVDVKVFVDTAPLMEKPLAQAAGLGWQGKHTNLVSESFGSWLFLGAILTSAALEPDLRGHGRPYKGGWSSGGACRGGPIALVTASPELAHDMRSSTCEQGNTSRLGALDGFVPYSPY